MRKIGVFLLLILMPFSLASKDPEIDDWGVNGDGTKCRACVDEEHELPNGVIVIELKCGSPETSGMYKTECQMVENICTLSGDNCFYDL